MARVFWPIFESGGCAMKEIEKEDFRDEKTLHDTIRKNLGVIFPSLEIVGDEVSVGDGKVDTVGFNRKTSSFALIEYKKGEKEGALEQLLGYLGDMVRHKGDFLQACGKKKGGATWDSENIAWNKCTGILMAPSFTKHQFNAAKNHKQIELHRIIKYEDKVLMIEMVEGQKPRDPQDDPKINDVQTLYDKLKKVLMRDLHLKKIETRAYHKWVLAANDKEVVCTIALQKKSLILSYTTESLDVAETDKVFVRHMIENGKKVGKRGRGDYMSKIHNEENVKKAAVYLEQVHRQKVVSAVNQRGQTHRNPLKQDDMTHVAQKASERTVGLYSELKKALLKSIPNLEIIVTKKYINWKSATSGASIFTVAVQKNSLRVSYNTKWLNIPRSDDFVRPLRDNGKRINVAGLGSYDSKIKTDADVKKAIHYIKKVHAEKGT